MDLSPQSGPGSKPSLQLAWPQYQACRNMLIFTLADNHTIGFPIAWLYRFDYRKDDFKQQLTLHLTEHLVTVVGRTMDVLGHQLTQGEGFHVSEMSERYLGIQRNERAHIASITIEPVVKPTPETTEATMLKTMK